MHRLHHPQCSHICGAATEAEKCGQRAFSPTKRVAIRNLFSDVQAQEACNNDDNYHYADDVENVHCGTPIALMWDFNMKARRLE